MSGFRAIRYYRAGVGYEVRAFGRFVGHVRRRGNRWVAEPPAGPAETFGTRRTAAEWLRHRYEVDMGRRVVSAIPPSGQSYRPAAHVNSETTRKARA